MEEKHVIEVDDYQHGLIINSLNNKRNELVEQGTRPQRSSAKNIEKWRDNAMIYCIESLGKATKDTESSDDEESE